MTDGQGVADDTPPSPKNTGSTSPPAAKSEPGGLDSEPGKVGGTGDTGAEVEIWVGRTHWKHYAGRLFVWGICNLAFAAVVIWAASRTDRLGFGTTTWLIAGVFAISGLIVVGRVFLTILGHRYRVTNQRLFIERGILSQTVDQTELIRVDDVRLYKSFLDRLLGLGSISILSTDTSDKEVLIEGVPEPDMVAEAIRTNMRILRQKSLFIENL